MPRTSEARGRLLRAPALPGRRTHPRGNAKRQAMSDDLHLHFDLESAATDLGMSAQQLGSWVEEGRVRAVRRHGVLSLRPAELARLRALPPGEVPRVLRVLPPRSASTESIAAVGDRRRRQGRRATDFTLEMLNAEIHKAVADALAPITSGAAAAPSHELEASAREIGRLRQRLETEEAAVGDLREQLAELSLALAEARDQFASERSLREADILQLAELQAQSLSEQGLTARLAEAESELAASSDRFRLLQIECEKQLLEQGEELERAQAELEQALRAREDDRALVLQQAGAGELAEAERRELAELRRRSEDDARTVAEQALELARAADSAQRHRDELEKLRAEMDTLSRSANQSDKLQGELDLLRSELDRLRLHLSAADSTALTMEAERARWSLESRSLQGEIERLNGVAERAEERIRELTEAGRRERENTAIQIARLEKLEQSEQGTARRFEEREHVLADENRRLREQVNSLTYRLQMAGSGSAGPSPEESRLLLDRLADAQTLMAEKDELLAQNYSEMSELRSRYDALQQEHYEKQHEYQQMKEEWSQLLARQLNNRQQAQEAAANHPPAAPKDQPNKGWGGLFRMRGDS